MAARECHLNEAAEGAHSDGHLAPAPGPASSLGPAGPIGGRPMASGAGNGSAAGTESRRLAALSLSLDQQQQGQQQQAGQQQQQQQQQQVPRRSSASHFDAATSQLVGHYTRQQISKSQAQLAATHLSEGPEGAAPPPPAAAAPPPAPQALGGGAGNNKRRGSGQLPSAAMKSAAPFIKDDIDVVFNRLMALEAFRKLHPSVIRNLCSYAFVERIDKGVIGEFGAAGTFFALCRLSSRLGSSSAAGPRGRGASWPTAAGRVHFARPVMNGECWPPLDTQKRLSGRPGPPGRPMH